jgi:homocysteine S-methyltransferase
MTERTTSIHDSLLDGVHVIDGGLASELEHLGARIDGPLWSAHVLEDEPEKLLAVHRAFIEAGSECIATASYQVSRMGYAECGLPPVRADQALVRSVELARQAAAEFPGRRVLIAGSLGPYGAALHNGAEYTGDYSITYQDLVRFHRERIEVFARAKGTGFSPYVGNATEKGALAPDLLAFETFPSLNEARAVCEALEPFPQMQGWFSFSCHDEKTVSHGEPLGECAALLNACPQILAIGVNCVPPRWVSSLLGEIRAVTAKPVLVYPNSGEGWDAANRSWIGSTDPVDFGRRSAEWFAAGAQIVGGCCRTQPEHIRAIAQAARKR